MNPPAGNNLPGGGLPEVQYDQTARGNSGVIAWIVIIVCLSVVVAFNQVSADHRKAGPPQLLAPNVPLEMVSRYTVGFNAFSASTHAQPAVDPTVLIVQQLDGAAKTLPDRLRVAIIVGELKGASARSPAHRRHRQNRSMA